MLYSCSAHLHVAHLLLSPIAFVQCPSICTSQPSPPPLSPRVHLSPKRCTRQVAQDSNKKSTSNYRSSEA